MAGAAREAHLRDSEGPLYREESLCRASLGFTCVRIATCSFTVPTDASYCGRKRVEQCGRFHVRVQYCSYGTRSTPSSAFFVLFLMTLDRRP